MRDSVECGCGFLVVLVGRRRGYVQCEFCVERVDRSKAGEKRGVEGNGVKIGGVCV